MSGSSRRIAPGVLVAVVVFCLAWLVSVKPIRDNDFWWHLATGKYITQTRALPEQDPFSLITPHISGVDDEVRTSMTLKGYWLAQVLLYYIYAKFSFAGIVAYKGFVYALAVLFMYLIMRRGGMGSAASGLALLPFFFPALFVYLKNWNGERPGHLSFVFALILVCLLEGIRDKALRGERPGYALMASLLPVMIIWANVHGGFILGIVIICIYMFEIILLPLVGRRMPGSGRMFAMYAGLAAIAAALINPNGFKAFEVIIDAMRVGGPPVPILEETSPVVALGAYNVGIYLYYIVAVIGFSLPVIRRINPSLILVLTFLVAISFVSLRHVQELVFLAFPIVVTAWAGLVRERGARYVPPAKAVVTAFLVMALLAGIMGLDSLRKSDSYITGVYPSASANFISRLRPEGNLFNYYDWGGYLIWVLYPRYKVFVDGRLLSYRASGAYADIVQSSSPEAWESMSREYGINTAIVPAYSLVGSPVRVFAAILNSRDWVAVYRDSASVVFLRKTEANEWIVRSMGIERDKILEWVRQHGPGRL